MSIRDKLDMLEEDFVHWMFLITGLAIGFICGFAFGVIFS